MALRRGDGAWSKLNRIPEDEDVLDMEDLLKGLLGMDLGLGGPKQVVKNTQKSLVGNSGQTEKSFAYRDQALPEGWYIKVLLGAGVNRHFIAPCGAQLRSEIDVEMFLDPNRRPALKLSRARYPLPVPVAKMPWREELLEAERGVTKDINITFCQAERQNNGAKPNEKQDNMVVKYRNTSVSSSLDDSQHSVRSARRELRLSHLGDSWTRRNEQEDSIISSRSLEETLDEVAWRKRNEKMRAGKYGNSSSLSRAVAEDSSSSSVDSFGDRTKDSFGDRSEDSYGDRSEDSFENSMEDSVVAWQKRRDNARPTTNKENDAENYNEAMPNQAGKYRNVSFFNQTSAGPEDTLQSCSSARRVLSLTGYEEERQKEQRKTALVKFASDDQLVHRWISDMPNKVKRVSGFPFKVKGTTKLPISEDGTVGTHEVNGTTNIAPGTPSNVNGMASTPSRTNVAADTACKVKDKAGTPYKMKGAAKTQDKVEEVGGLPGNEVMTNTLYDNVKRRDGRGCKMKDTAQATGNGKDQAEEIGKVKEPEKKICKVKEPEKKIGKVKEPVEKRDEGKKPAERIRTAKEPVDKIGLVKEPAKNIVKAKETVENIGQVKESAKIADQVKEPAEQVGKVKEKATNTGKVKVTNDKNGKLKKTNGMPCNVKETAMMPAKVKEMAMMPCKVMMTAMMPAKVKETPRQKSPKVKTVEDSQGGRNISDPTNKEEDKLQDQKKPVEKTMHRVFMADTGHTRHGEEEAGHERKKPVKRLVSFGSKATKVSIGGTETMVRAAIREGNSRHQLHLQARLASIRETGC